METHQASGADGGWIEPLQVFILVAHVLKKEPAECKLNSAAFRLKVYSSEQSFEFDLKQATVHIGALAWQILFLATLLADSYVYETNNPA